MKVTCPRFILSLLVATQLTAVVSTQLRADLPERPLSSAVKARTARIANLILSDYAKCGKTDPTWDGMVKQLLEGLVRAKEIGVTADELLTFWDLTEKINGTGCDDALVAFNRAHLVRYLRGASVAYPLMKTAMPGVEAQGYSKPTRFRCTYIMLNTALSINSSVRPEVRELHSKAATLLAEGITDPAYAGEGRRLFVSRHAWFSDAIKELQADNKKICDMVRQNANADPWLSHMVQGMYHIKAAWQHRGTGYAATVTEDGWDGFQSNIVIANSNLVAAYELHPEMPEAARKMMTISGTSCGGSPISMREWFDRAVKAEFDYIPAYNSMLYYARPRWGGSHEEMLQFGRECLATKRFDTRVPGIFFEAITKIALDSGKDWKEVFRKDGVDADIEQYFGQAIPAAEEPERRRSLQTQYVMSLWAAGRYEEAWKQAQDLGADLDNAAFCRFPTTRYHMLRDLAIMASPKGEDIRKADALIAGGQYEAGVQAYQAVLTASGDTPELYVYVLERLADCGLQEAGTAAMHVVAAMRTLGMKERLILAFRNLEARASSSITPELRTAVEAAVGSTALAFAATLPVKQSTSARFNGLSLTPQQMAMFASFLSSDLPRHFSEEEASSAFTAIDKVVQEEKEKAGLTDIKPGSELDTELRIAKTRIYLWQKESPKNNRTTISKRVMSELKPCRHYGRAIDFLQEHFRARSLGGGVRTYVGSYYHGDPLFGRDRNRQYVDSVLAPLKQTDDLSKLHPAMLDTVMDRASAVPLLTAAHYLATHEAPRPAAILKLRAMNWLKTLCSSTSRKWSAWHSMRTLGLVDGCDEDAIFFGEATIARGLTESAVCDTATHLARINRPDRAVELLCRLRTERKMHGGYIPKTKYPVSDKELSSCVKTIHGHPGISQTARKQIEIVFPDKL